MKGFIRLLILNSLISFPIMLAGQPDLPQRVLQYRSGDWTGYPMLRYIKAAAMGDEWIYFGSTGGILRYHYYEKKWVPPFTVSDGLESDHIRDVLFDFKTGYLWCVTDAGVSFREPSSGYWRNIPENLFPGPVNEIGVGKESIWTRSGLQVARIDPQSGFVRPERLEPADENIRWQDDPGPPVTQGYFMDPDYLWVQGGIQDRHFRTWTMTESVADKFGHQWIGTWGLGVGFIDLHMQSLSFQTRGPWAPDIRAMAWDRDGMWMGGFPQTDMPHGISYWDMNSDTWHYFEARYITDLTSDAVNAILFDGSSVWFATEEGLSTYNQETDSWRTYTAFNNLWDDKITCLAMSDSTLWAGTPSGINKILLSGNIIQKMRDSRLSHRMIYQLDTDGRDVWAATDRGIYNYNPGRKTWKAVDGYPGMIQLDITAVAAYDQEVWFGSVEGIQKLDRKTGEWTGFPAAVLPKPGYVHTLLPDRDAVWAGTENGLLKYIRNEDRWHLFTTADGLLDNDVRWLLLDGDYLWAGTPLGLTRFYWNASYRID